LSSGRPARMNKGRTRVIGAHVAQLAEHVLGKDEVSGSSPDMGSILSGVAALDGGR
jgi:hypothetical protein